jgi:hypothetical protein
VAKPRVVASKCGKEAPTEISSRATKEDGKYPARELFMNLIAPLGLVLLTLV